jgi:hypothetical protein
MKAHAKTALASNKKLVYHARATQRLRGERFR